MALEVLAVGAVLVHRERLLLARLVHLQDGLLEAVDGHVHARLELHGLLFRGEAEHRAVVELARVHQGYR